MLEDIQIGFLIFPQMTQLDVTGPAEVLSRIPGAKINMIWKNLEPVGADAGFSINPTTTLDNCPDLDVICVCGGLGVVSLLEDEEVLEFLRRQAEKAQYVTSVCTGSLLLGAAGLLRGYKSACHWAFREKLRDYGAEPAKERVVRDRSRISGGGVTAGIDFGLTLAAEIAGEEFAKTIQLFVEYDPAPPFDCGSPEKAGSSRVEAVNGLISEATA
ncbi:MAG: DJ-1/PfpI family protein [Candidatus Thiodiazotropha sp.]